MNQKKSISVSKIQDQWETYPEPFDFKRLVKVSKHLLKQCFDIEVSRNEDEDLVYLGPQFSNIIKRTTPSPSKELKAESINQEKESQNRDELTQVLGVVLKLGIEQGFRMSKQSETNKGVKETLQRTLSTLEAEGDTTDVAITMLKSAIELLESDPNVESS